MPIKSRVKKQVLHDALLDALNTVVGVLEPYVQSGKVPKEPVLDSPNVDADKQWLFPQWQAI